MSMKWKELKYAEEARQAIKKGLDILANAVKVTLGPKGRNVVYENDYLPPQVTKDGVTVARQIKLKDHFENVGCEMGKVVAGRTVETAGDGTTTAVVLCQAIYNEGLKTLSTGINPILLKRGMDTAVEELVNRLRSLAKPVSGKRKGILSVATIASNNDKEIGELIASAIDKVGEEGVITIEDSSTSKTSLEVAEGMQLNEGLANPYFINNRNLTCTFKKPLILISSKVIRDPAEIAPIFGKCIEAHRPLVVISSEGCQVGALATLLRNKMEMSRECMSVKAPGYGDRRNDMLEDIAILTGTKVVSDELGLDLKKIEVTDLGTCDRIEAGKETCTITKGGGDKEDIASRIEELNQEMDIVESEYEKEKLQERLAKMTSGVAVLKIGAPTETEMKEKKMRVEDALHATQAAIDEGIVPGGGAALYRAARDVEFHGIPREMCDDEKVGFDLVVRSVVVPLKTIVENAGMEGAEVVAKIKMKDNDYGLNVLTGKYGNLIKMGVTDPVKVVRLALENAVSEAGLALTTEAMVCDSPENEDMRDYKPRR